MRCAVLLGVALICGCGPQSYEEFRTQLSKVSCDRAVRCGMVGASDREHCPAMDLIAPAEEVDVAVKRGRLRFFSSGAQDCLDAVNGAPCDDGALGFRMAMRCHHVIEPAVPPGGTCYRGECEGGECQESRPGCEGVCIGFAEPGMTCVDAGPTANTCDPSVAYCGDGYCQQKKEAGGPCANDFECGYGWFCIDGKCGDALFGKLGWACGGNNPPCEEGCYCASSGMCATQAEKGKRCEGQLGCKPGAVCVGGTCQAWSDTDKPCATNSFPSGCPADQSCSLDGVCATFAPSGLGPNQRCSDDSVCLSGLFCRFGVCKPRLGIGGSCASLPTACRDGLVCDAGTQSCVLAICGA